jgi:DNA-binding response OmpR family regulator
MTASLQQRQRLSTILLAVGDDACRRNVKALLVDGGMDTLEARSGDEALSMIAAESLDAVVLDPVLPGLRGTELLQELRRTSDVPVVVLTDVADLEEKVRAFEVGADDYITRPFIPTELLVRIRAVVRRRATAVREQIVAYDALQIDCVAREVTLHGRIVDLTCREFDLLRFLASAPRRVFSRDELLRHVWGSCERWQDPATVTEHVRRIRHKIEPNPRRPRWITTVRSVGYRFEPVSTGS